MIVPLDPVIADAIFSDVSCVVRCVLCYNYPDRTGVITQVYLLLFSSTALNMFRKLLPSTIQICKPISCFSCFDD